MNEEHATHEEHPKKRRSLWPALFLIFIGAFFLLRSFHVFDWQDMWPLFLILIGCLLFFTSFGKRDKGAVFLHASTSECYGDPTVNPQSEGYWGNVNPIGLRSPYDEGKRFAESLTMSWHRREGLATRLVRIFNTYGPRMRADDGRALPNFINQALSNRPVTVYGDGTQTRSFCYVDDEVEGIVRLAASDFVEPVNIGNPAEIPILQAAEEVIELCRSKSRIEFRPLPQDDPILRRPDITRAKQVLGWEPAVDRRTGFTRTIEYFRQRAGA